MQCNGGKKIFHTKYFSPILFAFLLKMRLKNSLKKWQKMALNFIVLL